MLYVTTRSDADTYTAQRALRDTRGPDGGLFVPLRLPRLSREEVLGLGQGNFNKNLADTINLLFNTHLTGYDIDFAMGRYSVRLKQLSSRILMGECWHNLDWQFSRMVANLTALIRPDEESPAGEGDWATLGIRIGVLFGIFGELIREGLAEPEKKVDISVCAGDFSAPMSAWYAREMGLPIGNIICCCNENNNLWNFICHGQLRTDMVAVSTIVPEADITLPVGLERLIHACGGAEETERFSQTVHRGSTYYAEDALLRKLRQGIYATVTSEPRIRSILPAVYATHGYVLSPGGALCYGGLQDYRSRTGESRTALVLTEKSPVLHGTLVAEALGIPEASLENLI